MTTEIESFPAAAERLGITRDALRLWCRNHGHGLEARARSEWDALRVEGAKHAPPGVTRAIVLASLLEHSATAQELADAFPFLTHHAFRRTLRRLLAREMVKVESIRASGRQGPPLVSYRTTLQGCEWLIGPEGRRALASAAPCFK